MTNLFLRSVVDSVYDRDASSGSVNSAAASLLQITTPVYLWSGVFAWNQKQK